MKTIFCTFFLLLMAISHANYVPESMVASGPNGPVFTTASGCQEHYSEECIKIPDGYNVNFDRITVTKSQAESCQDNDACQAALASKRCDDSSEMAIKVLDSDPKEVYCTKRAVLPNSSLKTTYLAAKAQEDALEAAIQTALRAQACGHRVKALLLVRNAGKGLSNAQKKQLVTSYKDTITLLDAGSLDAAKEDILAATADGVLVTAGDKVALAAQLDSCKP